MTKLNYNGVDMPAFMSVQEIEFDTTAEMELNEIQISQKVGNIFGRTKRGGNGLTVTVFLSNKQNEKTIQEMSRELKQWLKGDNWKESRLIIDKDPTVYRLVKLSNTANMMDLFNYSTATLEFRSADGLLHAVSDTTEMATSNSLSVTYDGAEDTGFQLSFDIPDNCTSVTITAGAKTTKLTGAFMAGDTVVVDSAKKFVKVNGVYALTNLAFDSRWLYLTTGANTIEIATDGASMVAAAEITYNQKD